MTFTAAIIPVREFSNTKLRLKGLLGEEERTRLTASLLNRVLNAIEQSEVQRAIVVSSHSSNETLVPEQVKLHYSKVAFVKESRHHGGVNSAMEDGMAEAAKYEKNPNVLLIPSDLPFIDYFSINKVLGLRKDYDLIINPSSKKDGTSLLAFSLPKKFELHYDDDSFRKHVEEARKNNFRYLVLNWFGFSFDIDDESDLKLLMQRLQAKTIEDLINKLGV